MIKVEDDEEEEEEDSKYSSVRHLVLLTLFKKSRLHLSLEGSLMSLNTEIHGFIFTIKA